MNSNCNFIVTCAACRKRGAIGIYYAQRSLVWCDSAEEAEAMFRRDYECYAPVVVAPETEPSLES